MNVTKRHAGIFQCFVSNSLSKVDGGNATLEVVPRPKVESTISSSSSLTSFSEEEEDDFFQPTVDSIPLKASLDDKKGKKGGKHRPRGWFLSPNDSFEVIRLFQLK